MSNSAICNSFKICDTTQRRTASQHLLPKWQHRCVTRCCCLRAQLFSVRGAFGYRNWQVPQSVHIHCIALQELHANSNSAHKRKLACTNSADDFTCSCPDQSSARLYSSVCKVKPKSWCGTARAKHVCSRCKIV